MQDVIILNDEVFNSPVGAGKITGMTDSGYPQVNHVAVARLAIKVKEDQFLIWDANGSYSRGEWEMFIDDERFPAEKEQHSFVVVRSSQEAIAFCNAVRSLPKRISFDHDLGGDDTSMVFINWMIDRLYEDNPVFKLRKDFTFSVHSQNPVGANNIKCSMKSLIDDYFREPEMNFIAFHFSDNDFHEPLKEAIEYVYAKKLEQLSVEAFREFVIRGMVAFSNLRNISRWGFQNTKFIDRTAYFQNRLTVIQVRLIAHLPKDFEGYVLNMHTGIVSFYGN
ncbi:MAG: hypothetical protein PHQ58_04650 [Rhodoferax sp.]|uniref:cyclic-phosphate processing receiver domain-containing protein n=1 Tax=Rhodoferax sp. TaxID=50421 RepID=UPI0026144355|nr:cyclic-phosphate processing receiver domain-containing protein [Rhodoferax sp.]MDD2879702.1 hypothetical protein [Rhodoferax sp.]